MALVVFDICKCIFVLCLCLGSRSLAQETTIPLDGFTHHATDVPHIVDDQTALQPHEFDIVSYARTKLAQLSQRDGKVALKNSIDFLDADASDVSDTTRPPKDSFAMIESKLPQETTEAEATQPDLEQAQTEKEFRRLEKLTEKMDKKKRKKKGKTQSEPQDIAPQAPSTGPTPITANHNPLESLKGFDTIDSAHQSNSIGGPSPQIVPHSHEPQSQVDLERPQFGGNQNAAIHLSLLQNAPQNEMATREASAMGPTASGNWRDSVNAYIPDLLPLGVPQVIRSTNIHYDRVPEHLTSPALAQRQPVEPAMRPEIVEHERHSTLGPRVVSYPHSSMVTFSPPTESHYQSGPGPSFTETNRANYVEIKPNGVFSGPSSPRPLMSPLMSEQPEQPLDEPYQYRVINHYTSIQYPIQPNDPPQSMQANLRMMRPSMSPSIVNLHPGNHVSVNRPHHHHHHRAPLDRPQTEIIGGGVGGSEQSQSTLNPLPSSSPPLPPSLPSSPPASSEIGRLNQMNPVIRAAPPSRPRGTELEQGSRPHHSPASWRQRAHGRRNGHAHFPNRHFQSGLFGAPSKGWYSAGSPPPFLISTPFVDNAGYTHFPIFQAEASTMDPSTYDFDVDSPTFGDLSMSSSTSPIWAHQLPGHFAGYRPYHASFQRHSGWW